jgi:hypothetical protein
MVERLTPKSDKVEKITLSKVDPKIFAERTGGILSYSTVGDQDGSFQIDFDLGSIDQNLDTTTQFAKNKGKIFCYVKKIGDGSLRVDSGGYLRADVEGEYSPYIINIGFPTEIRQFKNENGGYDTFFVMAKTKETKDRLFCFWVSREKGIRYIEDAEVNQEKGEIAGLEGLDKDLINELIAARRLYE